jgi:hypothetical protein
MFHCAPNNESLLSWSTKESFAVVIFYDQWRMASSLANADLCFTRLINAALALGGAYYLPYRPSATQEQFNLAYPRARLFWEIKEKYDPPTPARCTRAECYTKTTNAKNHQGGTTRLRRPRRQIFQRIFKDLFSLIPPFTLVFSVF